jgi:hypothetical protein
LEVVSRRLKLFAFLNALFFGCAFLAMLSASLILHPLCYSSWRSLVPEVFMANWLLIFLFLLASNFIITAFAFVTLPGFVFFPLSAVTLGDRAVLWSLLLLPLPDWSFLCSLPALVLEGEAYVFAAAAGTIVGASWVKPNWMYAGMGLTRGESFRAGLKECLRIYTLEVFLLFISAAVETATILGQH